MLSPVPWCASSYGAWLPAAVPASATWGCDCNPRAPQHCVSIVGWSKWVGGEVWPFFEVAPFWGDELGKMGKILYFKDDSWMGFFCLIDDLGAAQRMKACCGLPYLVFSESTDVSGFHAPWFFHLLSTPPDTKLSSGAPPPKKVRSIKEWMTFLSLQEPDSDSGALVYDVAPYQEPLQQGWRLAFWWRSADPKIQLGLSFWYSQSRLKKLSLKTLSWSFQFVGRWWWSLKIFFDDGGRWLWLSSPSTGWGHSAGDWRRAVGWGWLHTFQRGRTHRVSWTVVVALPTTQGGRRLNS